MNTIKKGYTELYAVLSANEELTVAEVMDKLMPIMTAQHRNEAHYYDEDGRLVVFCYYHKQYEHVDQVPYGSKKNTKTGLNTMCKIGTNLWTSQYNELKNAPGEILKKVQSGEVEVADMDAEMTKAEEYRLRIVPLEVTHWNEAHADDRQNVS